MDMTFEGAWAQADVERPESFTITDDAKAEWALKKIKESTEEHDRLIALIDEEQRELNDKRLAFDNRYAQETDYLKRLLADYMATVKCKSTKTQDTYQLLTGKLVRKHPAVTYEVNDSELLGWLDKNNRTDLIKVKRSPAWAEVKKLLIGDAKTGAVVLESTGECVDGVKAVETPGSFDIKLG